MGYFSLVQGDVSSQGMACYYFGLLCFTTHGLNWQTANHSMHYFIKSTCYHITYTITSNLLLKRRLVRRLRLRGDSGNMASLTIFPVEQGRVGGNTVL